MRLVPGSAALTSSGTTGSALRLAVPILLAGLGGVWSERAGVVNIGLEGMMVLGSWFGAWGTIHHGVVWGLLLGMLGGAAGAAVHAAAAVGFRVDQIISGLAVNLLAAGTVRLLSALAYEGKPGGGLTQSPRVPAGVAHFTAPVLSGGWLFGWRTPDVLGWVERGRLFPFSDAAGVLRGLTTGVSALTVVAVGLIPLSAWLLRHTKVGLRLRAVGEHREAARSVGIAVARTQAAAVVVSGALAGLGGVYLVLEGAGLYREGQVGGRGFIGLAAVVFGNWRPAGVAVGAGLFGYADALVLREARSFRSLLLLAAFGLAVLAVRAGARRRAWALALAAGAAAFLVWFARATPVPPQLVFFTPHLVTLVVLAGTAQPASPGTPASWAPI
jgi:simple sugar transport system permease protein